MKKIKKILKWFFICIFALVFAIVIFRNELFLKIIRMEQSAKMDKPFTMLELPVLNDSIYQILSADFENNARDPYEYVLDEFNNHDIIFLGENHRIRHDLLFMQKLIPLLYDKGIRNMGFEFALNRDSLLIKEVITNKDFFDQEKANQIIFNLSPFWGYKEYIDLFKAAWEVNKNLPEGAEKFMIFGIMHDFDFSLLEKRSDEFDEEKMLKIRKGVADGDQFMANSIISNYIKRKKKTLVYCGMHHAFTSYSSKRTGAIVTDSIDVKTMTISLHYPWVAREGSKHRTVYPVNGYIDAFIRKHRSKEFAFGINVNQTSFGNLTDTTSWYVHDKDLKLSSFCDGYIYLKAFSMAEGVTIQDNFINGKNIKYARTQLPNPELRDGIMRFLGSKVFNQIPGLDTDIKYQYRHLY